MVKLKNKIKKMIKNQKTNSNKKIKIIMDTKIK